MKGCIKMRTTKRMLTLLLAVVMVLSLGCVAYADGEQTTYRTLYSSEVDTLNYLDSTQAVTTSLTFNLIDCLVEYDSYGNVEPALATSWEPNEDASVWTFHLREGVKWVDKDGNEVADVTANDWVAAAHYICDAANDASTYSVLRDNIAGASAYYDYTAYQLALPTAKDGTDENGNPAKVIVNEDGEEEVLEEAPEASLEDIGVVALDDYTLQFTLTGSKAYFVSLLSHGAFMPVYEPFLEECGDKFGTSNEYLLYNGAYILSSFKPQQEHVLTKNAAYWEPECVYIEEVRETYNAEAASIATTMYLNGELDAATVSSDLLSAMMADPKTADQIHSSRPSTSYCYWYLFNFDANFDEEYEPENWTIVVNNENFRQSLVHALNRIPALAANDPLNPTANVTNTITPSNFSLYEGKDYTSYEGLDAYTAEGFDYFDPDLALEYKDKAVEELTAAGATFPVKVLMCYNPSTSNWANECQVVEQQMESVLGTDYIDIIVEAGPSDGFLAAVRRAGNYAFMKCNWGADYADPETWTDPFVPGSSYNFIDKSTAPETVALYEEYCELVNAAKAITTDVDARYAAFAKAEAFLLDHAFVVPIHTNEISYSMSKLNVFEGQYAMVDTVTYRYKDQHIQDKSMSIDEYNAAYAEWAASKN